MYTTSVAGWSSQVARQAHNLKVRGSNPLPATKISKQNQSLSIPIRLWKISTFLGIPPHIPLRFLVVRAKVPFFFGSNSMAVSTTNVTFRDLCGERV